MGTKHWGFMQDWPPGQDFFFQFDKMQTKYAGKLNIGCGWPSGWEYVPQSNESIMGSDFENLKNGKER